MVELTGARRICLERSGDLSKVNSTCNITENAYYTSQDSSTIEVIYENEQRKNNSL